jgi:hypothetical protein
MPNTSRGTGKSIPKKKLLNKTIKSTTELMADADSATGLVDIPPEEAKKVIDIFDTLNDKQKELVLLVGDVNIESIKMTQQEMYNKLELDNETFTSYMKIPAVLECIAAYRKYYFPLALRRHWENDMLERYNNVNGKKLDKDDRVAVMRLLYQDDLPQIQVSLHINDSKLNNVLDK